MRSILILLASCTAAVPAPKECLSRTSPWACLPAPPTREYDLSPTVWGASLGEVCEAVAENCAQLVSAACERVLSACGSVDDSLLSVAPTPELWHSAWHSCQVELPGVVGDRCVTLLDVSVPP